jgi:hypothetical protein
MRLLFGRFFKARYQVIDNLISRGAEVIDVCAGDCRLYLDFLQKKGVKYLGLEYSPHFVRWANRAGVEAKIFDVWKDDIPAADVVVMQASLYQFIPREEEVLEKLLASSRKWVIIAEPVRNVSDSRFGLLAKLGRLLTQPRRQGDGKYTGDRFNRESLTRLFRSFEEFERSFLIPGGREMVGIFRGLNGR